MRRDALRRFMKGGSHLRGQAEQTQTHISLSPLLFDPWLICNHSAVRRLAREVEQSWADTIDADRVRALRAVDRQSRRIALRAILANLAFAIASDVDPPAVSISLRGFRQKTSRYEQRGFRALPNVVDGLSKPAGGTLLRLQRSNAIGTASAIIATSAFVKEVENAAGPPQAKHFSQAPGRETVILSRVERNYASGHDEREMVEYADDSETALYRSEIETINDHLRSANLGFEPDGGPPVMTGIRSLRRRFNLPHDGGPIVARFDLGGRLFGGWWLALPKTRRHAIRIEGELVADLDFASMFLRLAYLEAGCTPPDGDLYGRVDGLGGAQWRPGLKQVVSAMLFRSRPLLRLPRGSVSLLPLGTTAPSIRQAVLKAHPQLTGVFETSIGLRLMFTESQILIDALLALIAKDIVALPMHDGLMVAQSNAMTASTIMQDAAERITGCRLPVAVKASG